MKDEVAIATIEGADALGRVIAGAFVTTDEVSANHDAANVVDGLFAIARAIEHLARATEGDGGDPA